DFGIAEMVGRTSSAPGAKQMVTGTPDYMSPEQIRGREIDARADVYACGVILFEMATGKVPFFSATTPDEIAWLQVSQEPPRPSSPRPDVDGRREAIILGAMAKDRGRRYQSARELRADLRTLADAPRPGQVGGYPQAPAPTPPPAQPPRVKTPSAIRPPDAS